MFDNNRLRIELGRIHRTLGQVAASPRGKGLLDDMRRTARGSDAARLWQALHADCLRIAYAAVAADGQIDDHEIDAFRDLLSAAARSYADTLADHAGVVVADRATARRFVARYASDAGPFGKGAGSPWPGLALCRRAAEIGEGAALAQYEHTMTWLIAEACRIGGVDADPRWRGRIDELDELRRSLARHAVVDEPGIDLRVRAFLSPAWVFTAVQQASSVFENDPFDVESIHRHARDSFEQLTELARMSSPLAGGRMLLVLGDSGGGKTHLLRDFRRQVQEYGRGFVVYAQLQSRADDYERYLLQHLVDSLARPYATASGERTGLCELASGIVRLVSRELQARVQGLIDDTWEGAGLTEYVNALVDDLLREAKLASFDRDLLRVLLYALCPDPRITSSVYRYLRCEDMHPHDRKWIGDVIPRTGPEHPHTMFRELGRLAALTQRAVVVMVDQVDLSGFEQSFSDIFRRAIDALYRITSEISSAVAVIACLKDLYQAVRVVLNRPALDRLEKNPPIAWLEANCSYGEIEEVVSRRLQWLFDSQGAVFRPDQPIYPIPEDELRLLDNRRLRDVLEWCHEFQTRCALAGKILGAEDELVTVGPRATEEDLDHIAALWNDAMHAQGIDVPTDDEDILAMLGFTARACAEESGLGVTEPEITKGLLRVSLSAGDDVAPLAIAVTNRNYHRGAFPTQIESLRRRARNATAVAVRTLEFPRGEACDRAIAQLAKDGGRRAHLDASTLHTLAAFQHFQPPFPADRVLAWRRRARPISSHPAVAALFDLDRLRAALPIDAQASAPAPTIAETRRVGPAPAVEPAPSGASPTRGGPDADPMRRPPRTRAATPPPDVAPPKIAPEPQTVAVPPIPPRRTPPSMPAVDALRTAEPVATTSGTHVAMREAVPEVPSVGVAASPSALPVARARAPLGTRSPVIEASELWIGNSPGFEAAPRVLELGALRQHGAIVGDERATNVTLALNVVEQLLERDVAVVLVDRHGDLAGHARPDWWRRSADPDRAHALAARLDVRLFTPGLAAGRPLALSVVPELSQVADHERDRAVQRAARDLAAIVRLGDGSSDAGRLAVLTQAIAVLAGRGARTLADLIALVDQQDDVLVARTARAGHYSDTLFKRIVHDLQSVQVSDAALFDPAAETLSLFTLIGSRPVGKTPLAIVSTQFLDDVARAQAWVAHLIGCVVRQPAPSRDDEITTMLVLDDADLLLPVSGKAASKEPLQELLKLSPSPGVGVLLISQRPAALDHRCREAIHTWFLGRMADARSNDRLNALFDRLPPVRGKLAMLEPRRFVLLKDRSTLDLECAPSLLQGEALTRDEVTALAAVSRLPTPPMPDDPALDDPTPDDPGRGAVGRAGVPAWAQ
jgi:hypothetical protein